MRPEERKPTWRPHPTLWSALVAGIACGCAIFAFEAYVETLDLESRVERPLRFVAMVALLFVPAYAFAIGAPPRVREGIRGLPLNAPPPPRVWPRKLLRGIVYLVALAATFKALSLVS